MTEKTHAETNSDCDFGPDVTWCKNCKAVFGTPEWDKPCPANTTGQPDTKWPHIPEERP
jgi:hypothetical protein